MRKTITALLGAALLIMMAVPANAAGATTEIRDVFGQGLGGPIVAAGGAVLTRSDTGLVAQLTMPTPVPGTYLYPPGNAFQPNGAVPGHPEAFSFWAFVFNYPDLCSDLCDANDLGNTPAQGGVFNVAGHVVGGSTLRLGGRVSLTSPPFAGMPLTQPRTAAVHLAVAPHGALDPALLPDQITKPIGGLPMWWLAIF